MAVDNKRVILFINIFIAIVITVIFSVILFSFSYMSTSGPLKEDTSLIIKPGSSLKRISYQLSEKNIIKYPEVFRLIIRLTEASEKMHAGEFTFHAGISPYKVFKKIEKGDVVLHNVTIPEGLMTFQILKIIAETENLIGEVPSGIKEGELLPETYSYTKGKKRSEIIERMKKAMRETVDELWESRKENLPIKNKKQAVILASIIEKETGVHSERKRVAAVFINRLRKGMMLQTDPTVIYAITKGKYVLERSLIYKDLEIESKYNTYKNYGLPPAPIANPGRAAIAAALNPIESSELYFVADGTGGHKFSKTLKEHNNNVSKWRKVQKQQRIKKKENQKTSDKN